MKFKEIKPGMVIHCPKEEDARALLEYLCNNLDYYWGGKKDGTIRTLYENGNCYHVIYDNAKRPYVTIDTEEYFRGKRYEITEFSDLIEPDDSPINSDTDSPMSEVEVLEWIEKNCDDSDLMQSIFGDGCENCDDMFGMYPPKEILKRITAYEAAKKEKPVEVEEGYRCLIYKNLSENSKETIADYMLWNVDKETAEDDVVVKARERAKVLKHELETEVRYICRVKGA